MNRRNVKEFKTPSYSSPKGGRRACLCPDNTYSIKCCDGSLQAQGIGSITKQSGAFSDGFSDGFLT